MTISEKIKVLQHAEKGGAVERRIKSSHKPKWEYVEAPIWDFSALDYRIKPEPKRIPLNQQDLIERRKLGFEAMWVKSKQDFDYEYIIEQIRPDGCMVHGVVFAYADLEHYFVGLDGTPCNKESECE